MLQYLDTELMNEVAETGFREIWIVDESPLEEYSAIQLIGIKSKRWRGLNRHRSHGTKPFR